MGGVPVALIYLIAALWVGLNSAGLNVPTEPVMLFVGSLAATARATTVATASHGRVNVPLAIFAMAVGSVLFGLLAYTLGQRYGNQAIQRFGRYVGLPSTRADHIELWLRHRGLTGITLSRLVPLVRSFSALISGMAEIPMRTFLIGTFVGSAIYCAIWLLLGAWLGSDYVEVFRGLDHLGWVGVASVVALVAIVWVIHRYGRHLALLQLASHFHLFHHLRHKQVTPGVADA
jgi:membrane protein DedA with SNARE-associated domain